MLAITPGGLRFVVLSGYNKRNMEALRSPRAKLDTLGRDTMVPPLWVGVPRSIHVLSHPFRYGSAPCCMYPPTTATTPPSDRPPAWQGMSVVHHHVPHPTLVRSVSSTRGVSSFGRLRIGPCDSSPRIRSVSYPRLQCHPGD